MNNTNIHVDHNAMHFSYNSNKQADKAPTPELLCVFGPNNGGKSPASDFLKQTNERQQRRSYSRSPNRTDDIPRIDATSAYQYSSEGSYQTPTHQKLYPLRHSDNFEDDSVLRSPKPFGPEMLEDFEASPMPVRSKG